MTDSEEKNLTLLLGKVIGKQDEMHYDLKEFKKETHRDMNEVNSHLKESNGRLADVEHQIMSWRDRFLTAFAIVGLSAPFIVEQSREFIIDIII